MNTPKFQKRVEDFVCEHCGTQVKGGGYTNHCPECLWSKHVDVNPGDRAAACGSMMEPVALEGTSPEYVLVHRCISCGFEHRNKSVSEDSPDALLEVAKKREKGNN